MKYKILFIALMINLFFSSVIISQNNQPTQSIRGIVIDKASGIPLAYASISLSDLPQTGTTTNDNGKFTLNNIPVGRHNLHITSIGYKSVDIREIMLTSAKEIYLEIQMDETFETLSEIIISPSINKEVALNKMTLSGARMLSVEEATRFAGGMDDPARLVSSFAGVSPGIISNGISVHGNAPSLLQWKLEDVEIPNPNHFADVAVLGGGILTSLSGNILGNSDFLISAFPAEYNNAISGVFDMKLRNGNSQKFQHTFQAGILGLDVASEGPLGKRDNASYIFNYRYSTTGLMNRLKLTKNSEQILDYQDINFKLNLPTEKWGVFSLWGTALKDKVKPEITAPEDWNYNEDAKDSKMSQASVALGLSHRYFFANNASLKTTIATTYSKTKTEEDLYDFDMVSTPTSNFNSEYTNLILTSTLNKRYSEKHTNKIGFTLTNMSYNMDFKLNPFGKNSLETISEGKGNTNLISVYSSSLFHINDNISATLGLNGQFLTLNNNWTIEPRGSVKWQVSDKNSLGLAYGLHSRMEKMDVYFVKTKETGNRLVNKNLDLTKTQHISMFYNYKLSDDINIKVEPYFQYLYDVPVIANSSYSILNRSLFYVENELVNKGKGRNYGVDVTFEKHITKGLYYMLTAAAFNSDYCGGDGIWHNSKYNRNYIVNGLIGKEWMLGSNNQNVLSINIKLTLQGGIRYSPVDEEVSLANPNKEIQYDESKAFSKQLPPMFLANYTVSYRINRQKISHEFAVKAINTTGYKEYFGHEYNLKKGVIEPRRIKNSILNLTYRIDF